MLHSRVTHMLGGSRSASSCLQEAEQHLADSETEACNVLNQLQALTALVELGAGDEAAREQLQEELRIAVVRKGR